MMMMMAMVMTEIQWEHVQYFRVRLQRPSTTSYLFVDVFPHNASEFTVIIIIVIISLIIMIIIKIIIIIIMIIMIIIIIIMIR